MRTRIHPLSFVMPNPNPARENASVKSPQWRRNIRLSTGVLKSPALARFFDPRQFLRAQNEVSYTTGSGDVRRIDRLVEFEDAVWVLDYKTGNEEAAGAALIEEYRAQIAEYCAAMQDIYRGKQALGAIVFADGNALTSES